MSAVSLPLSLLRLLGLVNTAHFFILVDLGFSAFALLSLIAHGTNFVRINVYSILLLLTCCLSALIGLSHDYSIQKVIVDVARPLIFFSLYTGMRYAPDKLIQKQGVSLWAANVFYVFALGSVISGLTMLALGWNFYLSLTEVSYLFPIAGLWLLGAHLRSMTLAGALFFGGRRGALLALFVALIPVLSRPSLRNFIYKRVAPAMLVFCALMAIPSFRATLTRSGTVAKITSVFSSASMRQDEGRHFDAIARSLDDRLREVNSVLRDLNRTWPRAILGMGSGYTYFVESDYFSVEIPWTRGVHFSPLGIYAYYGLLGLLFTYIFLARIVWAAGSALRHSSDPVTLLCAFFVIGFFTDSFTAFSIFLSPLFAICCGLLMNKLESNSLHDQTGISRIPT